MTKSTGARAAILRRQKQIAKLAEKGKSSKQIANRFGLSQREVRRVALERGAVLPQIKQAEKQFQIYRKKALQIARSYDGHLSATDLQRAGIPYETANKILNEFHREGLHSPHPKSARARRLGKQTRKVIERERKIIALDRVGLNLTQIAKELSLERNTLYSTVKRMRIKGIMI